MRRLQAMDRIRPIRPIRPIEIEIEIGIEIGIDPYPVWMAPGPHAPSNLTAELGQHRNYTVAVPGVSCPNPITRPFDTDSDTDSDPDLASPSSLSDDRW